MNPAEFANLVQLEEEFWWFRGMRRILFTLLDPWARRHTPRRVLEAGCGTGHLALALATRYGWTVDPVDLSTEGLARARAYGVPRLVQGDICRLPYAAGAFDALLSMDVFVHLAPGDEAAALAEFARVLAPGGLLVLRAAAFDLLRSRHSAFVGERQRFTRPGLTAAAEAAGFTVRRATYANSFLLPVALAKFRVIEPLLGGEVESGVQPVAPWLDRLLYQPLALEAGLLARGVNLPAGQSLLLVAERR